MRDRFKKCKFGLLGLLLSPLISGGCASPVPGGGVNSGRQLIVTMTFSDLVYPSRYYFFVINRFGLTGSQTANGPIAVFGSTSSNGGWGNGFVTGSPGAGAGPTDYGVTDYVEFNNSLNANGVGVYHFNGPPGGNQGLFEGYPISYSPVQDPSTNNGSQTIRFTLDLSQLVTDTTDPTAKAQEAQAIQWLQVNIIATDTIPNASAPATTQKDTDSMGNSLSSIGQSSYLTISLSQSQTYSSQTSATLQEPTGDVYPTGAGFPEIDLTSWTIQVVNTGG